MEDLQFPISMTIISLLMMFMVPNLRPNAFGYKSLMLGTKHWKYIWKHTNKWSGVSIFIGSFIYIILIVILLINKLYTEQISNRLYAIYVGYLTLTIVAIEAIICIKIIMNRCDE